MGHAECKCPKRKRRLVAAVPGGCDQLHSRRTCTLGFCSLRYRPVPVMVPPVPTPAWRQMAANTAITANSKHGCSVCVAGSLQRFQACAYALGWSGGRGTCHQDVDLALCCLPNLWTRCVVVRFGVGWVVKLLQNIPAKSQGGLRSSAALHTLNKNFLHKHAGGAGSSRVWCGLGNLLGLLNGPLHSLARCRTSHAACQLACMVSLILVHLAGCKHTS
jgi:hypothetical protein